MAPSCGERLSSRACQCAADSECGGAEWGPDFLKDGYCFLAYIQACAKLYFGILRMTVTRLLAESFVRLTKPTNPTNLGQPNPGPQAYGSPWTL